MMNLPEGLLGDHARFLRVRPSGAICIGPAGAGVQSIGTRLGAPQAKAL
jgi:hypothetical protein